jgi:cytoskeletal protein RodZ
MAKPIERIVFPQSESNNMWGESLGPPPDGLVMSSVAEILQSARLERGLDLATIADRTKINVKWLAAIEAGDRKSLPGGFFYKSFAHQYAGFLGLETTAIDAEIGRQLVADQPVPLAVKDNQNPRKLSSGSRAGMTYFSYATLVLVLVACTIADGWWSKSRRAAPQKTPDRPTVAENNTTQEPARSVSHASAPQAAPVAAVASPAPSKVQLDLTATEETWLSVSSDGAPVFTGFLAANQTKNIESHGNTKLLVGNASGLVVRVDGKPLGALGAHGQVRVLNFRPDKS